MSWLAEATATHLPLSTITALYAETVARGVVIPNGLEAERFQTEQPGAKTQPADVARDQAAVLHGVIVRDSENLEFPD